MSPSLRLFTWTGVLLLFGMRFNSAATAPAQPAVPVAVRTAAPAFVDVVTFETRFDGESRKLIVTSSPSLTAVRIDEATEGYSVIYEPSTQHYTGLEHKNYTYWEFSWPEVRALVETSKRYEARLQELGNLGINSDNHNPSTNTTTSTSASSSDGDDSGYVWRPTSDKKRIADLDCVRWTGDTVSGERVEAWCYPGPLPKITAAVEQLHAINEPMALVPVRNVAPDIIFSVFHALARGGVTPVLINWGDSDEKSRFAFIDAKTRDGKLGLFTVPKLYVKTTLVTMDGMMDQKK